VHHLLVHATSAWVIGMRTARKFVITKLAPDADDLDAFGGVGIDKKVIAHGAPRKASIIAQSRRAIVFWLSSNTITAFLSSAKSANGVSSDSSSIR
jgi:hypothetical protein